MRVRAKYFKQNLRTQTSPRLSFGRRGFSLKLLFCVPNWTFLSYNSRSQLFISKSAVSVREVFEKGSLVGTAGPSAFFDALAITLVTGALLVLIIRNQVVPRWFLGMLALSVMYAFKVCMNMIFFSFRATKWEWDFYSRSFMGGMGMVILIMVGTVCIGKAVFTGKGAS